MSTLCPYSIVIYNINFIELKAIVSQFAKMNTRSHFELTQTDMTLQHINSNKVMLLEYQIKANNFETYLFPPGIDSISFSTNTEDLSIAMGGIKSNLGSSLRIESPTELQLSISPSYSVTIAIDSFKVNHLKKMLKLKQSKLDFKSV